MLKAQLTLAGLLEANGQVTKGRVPYPRLSALRESDVFNVVTDVYRNLGGKLDSPPLNLRAWDIEYEGMAVEFDECLHFNRYRLVTLDSPAYQELSGFPLFAYQGFCRDYEFECLSAGSWGGRWSNRSCDQQFGAAGPKGQLMGSGSSRWKQRAFYDFVKDLSQTIIGTKIVRFAVWDTVEDEKGRRNLEEALEAPAPSTAARFLELLWVRAA